MVSADKIDLFKLHKAEYAAPKQPALVDVDSASYLSIKGRGMPGGEEFQAKVGALYAAAYTLKFTSKEAGRDYGVCKLEGLYDDSAGSGEGLAWELLIRIPEFIGARDLEAAAEKIRAKGQCPEIDQVTIERVAEGRCVQMLHVGPYSDEGPTIERMRAFAAQQKLSPRGRHHEIYLSDPRRVEPARLKTILRMPVRA